MTAEPPGTAGVDQRPKRAWLLARVVVTVVFFGHVAVGLTTVLTAHLGFVRTAYAVLALAGLLAIQLLYFSRSTIRLGSRLSVLVLLGQAALAYLPLLTFGQLWTGLPAFVAGSALLVFPPRFAWPVFGAVMASAVAIQASLTGDLVDILYTLFGMCTFALDVYLTSKLARMVTELHDARSELARRAVAEQRLRFARDLHDLLGLSLSAIALKGELVRRLISRSGEQAQRALTEITDLAQKTLSDVRSVARGYREVSLANEFRTAESLLNASDIAVQVHLDHDALPVQTRSALAKALRAGVTDVLRRNGVEHCEISVSQRQNRLSLVVTDDGRHDEDAIDQDELAALREEVSALGGTMSAGLDERGSNRLSVELPLPADGVPGPNANGPGESRPPADARLVRNLLIATFTTFTIGVELRLLYLTREWWQIALTAGYLLALLALQLSYFSRPATRLRSPQTYGLLFVQACLIYLPLIPLQQHWVSIPGMLAGNALLVLPPIGGWTVFALTVGSVVWINIAQGVQATYVVFAATSAVLSSMIVFGLIWLLRLATELDNTRRRLAQVAIAEERLRFARDLHDLLGMTLSAITLKSQLACRVLQLDRDKASDEVDEILGLTRQALSDVRSVASGYRELSLESESRTAQSILVAADVRVRLEMEHQDLPAPVRTVLAVVLREGVTNVLRHSEVEHCEIAVRRVENRVSLEIVNDGVRSGNGSAAPRADGRAEAASSGIENMSERVTALGGRLTAGIEPDGRFRLHAVVPA
ncbi:sensor histidine kinase [Amycolatopsis sp. NPDC059021]|uniref:sensor histidine kinase n=1 Tax=Amycolatopsis sp. NPDC059021 TaxID=3346704 RepID=UPI00366B7840